MGQRQNRALVFALLLFTGANVLNCIFWNIRIIEMTENQILYTFSSAAQIVGALLGLTIAGYSIADSKLKDLQERDETSQEYIKELRSESFFLIWRIALSGAIVIALCLVVLSCYDKWPRMMLFFTSEVCPLFLYALLLTICLVYSLRPNALQDKRTQERKSIEESYPQNNSPEDKISLGMFVMRYNRLEELIKTYVAAVLGEDIDPRIRLYSAFDVLMQHEVFNRQICSTIDELRRYRNAVVHSTDERQYVDGDIYETLNGVFARLKAMYEKRNTNQWFESKNELLEYINQRVIGEVETTIMQMLSKDEYTARQIAEKTGFSSGRVANALRRLNDASLIMCVSSGPHRIWRRTSN